MVKWKEVLTQITPDAEGRMAELRGRLYSQMGDVGPLKLIAFRGYGTPEHLFLRGHVIEEQTCLTGEPNDQVWANLVHIYSHTRCARVQNAVLAARFQEVEKIIEADERGFFEVHFRPRRPLVEQRIWHTVELQLISPIPDIQSRYPIKTTGQVFVPMASARYGIISTIDSTLLPTDRACLVPMARNAFLRNARPQLPFPGEAALYRALYAGASGMEMNPIFYCSSTSGNLYDLLVQHINLQSMPSGPVLFTPRERLNRIRRILDLYPRLPFVLIGDAEQHDAENYTSLACQYHGRIQAIYLRVADISPRRAESLKIMAEQAGGAGARLVLARNGLALARAAADQGLLSPSALAGIAEDAQKDERPLNRVEALINESDEPGKCSLKISRQAIKKGGTTPAANEMMAWIASKQAAARQSPKKNK